MRFTTAEVADATGGRASGPDGVVDGARHDSREVAGGELFVPVPGERDGHDFIAAAVAAGAGAHLTARAGTAELGPAVVVDDPVAALGRLGAAGRSRVDGPVVGVTGSVGKTTTKDLLAVALGTRWPTAAATRSFNNEIGVPLTILNAPDGTGALVLEMGARGRGHIAELCAIGSPTVGVVTEVAMVHTELFGDLDAVADTKAELIDALPPAGLAVLNADNPRVAAMAARSAAPVVTYSAEGLAGADVVAEAIDVDDDLRAGFDLRSGWGSVRVRLAVRGAHNVGNALAAAAVALGLGADPDAVAEALGTATVSPWRMELVTLPSGARLLNDAYNAGPASMAAALDALARLPGSRRVAVLGTMAELGADGPAAHERIARQATELGLELVAVGTDAYGPAVAVVDGVDEAVAWLGPLGAGDAVLVKGSRVAGLERLAVRLAG